jgi:hypothetical protein
VALYLNFIDPGGKTLLYNVESVCVPSIGHRVIVGNETWIVRSAIWVPGRDLMGHYDMSMAMVTISREPPHEAGARRAAECLAEAVLSGDRSAWGPLADAVVEALAAGG